MMMNIVLALLWSKKKRSKMGKLKIKRIASSPQFNASKREERVSTMSGCYASLLRNVTVTNEAEMKQRKLFLVYIAM